MYLESISYIDHFLSGGAKRLLQNGLRVSTPPENCGRTLTPNENTPVYRRSPTTIFKNKRILFTESSTSSPESPSDVFRFPKPKILECKKTNSPRRSLAFSCENFSSISTDSGISEDGFSDFVPIGENSPIFQARYNNTVCPPSQADQRKRKLLKTRGNSSKRLLTDRASVDNRAKTGSTLFQYGFTKEAKSKPSSIINEIEIKKAVERSTSEELIGDFTKPFVLPLIPGRHQDLKSITSETLAKLINGEYSDLIESFQIIDCRYPYEYNGGHIRGATNLYNWDHIEKSLLENKSAEEHLSSRRNILVFHCEYSIERGPLLMKFLRKEDRCKHEYPKLTYPEVYLLHDGYKAFFESHKDLCEPQAYKEMLHPDHSSEFKHFNQKSKSWSGKSGKNRKYAMRSLSRLGL